MNQREVSQRNDDWHLLLKSSVSAYLKTCIQSRVVVVVTVRSCKQTLFKADALWVLRHIIVANGELIKASVLENQNVDNAWKCTASLKYFIARGTIAILAR